MCDTDKAIAKELLGLSLQIHQRANLQVLYGNGAEAAEDRIVADKIRDRARMLDPDVRIEGVDI